MILRSSRISAAAMVASVFAFAFAAPRTASANLLLYDGFATATDDQSRATYSSSVAKLGNSNSGVAWTTGLSSDKKWSDTSGVVFSFPNKGLALPAAFADGTGDQFTARGGGAGYNNSNAPDTNYRAKNRAITSTMPTTGKLYYRCLMQIDSTAFNALKGTSWRYNGTGISATPAVNAYDNQDNLKNNGIRVAFYGRSDQSPARVDIGLSLGSHYTTVLQGTAANTTYIVIVELDYDTAKGKVYVAPIADYDTRFAWTAEDLDASDSTASSMTVLYLDGSYKTNGGYVIFDEIAVGTALTDVAVVAPATAPALGDVSLSRTGAATYAISAEVLENAADTVSWIAEDGMATTTNAFATAVAVNTTATGTVSGLAADKTYRVSVLAESHGEAASKVAGVIYTGELTLGATTDAQEYGLVAGGVEVSRATADPFPLSVNYTITGSAGTEGLTWAAPTVVTIPAGETNAVLSVVPLMDGAVTADVTITVMLAAGSYEIPATASKTLTLYNLAAPAGKKTWVAAANGNASDGANWQPVGTPTASDHILFDGNFSNARCTWDAAATHAVASWEQTAAFTNTVEIQTTYEDGDFPVLVIADDFIVNGGTITQTANSNAQVYRLSATVGGDFVVASGAQITAKGKGYSSGNFPTGSACGVHGGSVNDLSKVYGDLKHPVDIGSGGVSEGLTGGGAIHLLVSGGATIGGTLSAQPSDGGRVAHGAGGSIYLQAASVAGSGIITAAGRGYGGYDTRPDGAGGRIAVILTSATILDLPAANLRCNGTTAGYGRSSGGGTIFVKTAAQENGTLYVVNNFDNMVNSTYWPTKRGVTPIPAGQTWTLDEIVFRGVGILCVPEGTTLEVPLSGVCASSGTRTAGILYEGGTINFGATPYTLSGNWVFQADRPFTFNGDVTVTGGASLGCLRFSGSITDGSDQNGAKFDDYAVCDVAVNGNLAIASGGYASAEMGGPCGNAGTGGLGDGNGFYPRHGGQYAPQSGNHCYGSVFDPVLPGQFAQCGDHATIGVGGGALKLTVTGDLVVDGRITADGVVRSKSSAAAGSVNIQANTLSGVGSISATGNKADAVAWGDPSYHGVGGRIAVRVTGEDVGTTGIWTKFAARGCATNQVNTANARNQNSSAGTIYLQGASDGEKGGTIYVKNQASYDTSNVATWIPAASRGDAAADFKKAKLVIADRGVVAIGTDIRFASVSVAARSKLDLHGQKVKTTAAWLGGDKLVPGTYTAANAAVSDFVTDSAGGGELIVCGQGTFLFLQ